jgi:hypothetical protein
MSPIYLAPNEPRCSGHRCQIGKPCARKEAPYQMGRPLTDFSASNGPYVPADCCVMTGWPKWIALSAAVEPERRREAKDWIGAC